MPRRGAWDGAPGCSSAGLPPWVPECGLRIHAREAASAPHPLGVLSADGVALTPDLCLLTHRVSRDEQGPRARRENWYVTSFPGEGGAEARPQAEAPGLPGHSAFFSLQGRAGELGEAGPSGEPGVPVSTPSPQPLAPHLSGQALLTPALPPRLPVCRETSVCPASVARLATGAQR